MEVTMNTKILIAYYSRRGENYSNGRLQNIDEGNTEPMAKVIQSSTGADLFEIDTAQEYPLGYTDTTRVAKGEYQKQARPELKKMLGSINDYDVIYLGYPNWWNTMPMACFTFLDAYDFSGKTIIPFCTHEGSGLGNSVRDIRKALPSANVLDGYALTGSAVRSSHELIKAWLNHYK
jgi:flavodoxin